MLKIVTVLLALALLASISIVLRRRIKRAFKAVIILYLILLAVRLSQAQTDQERLISVGIVLGLFFLAWLIVWGVASILLGRSKPKSP